MKKYDTVIGLEIHVQLNTKSKMFCSCSTTPVYETESERKNSVEEPNRRVCEICLGYPGTLPVPNKLALELAMKMGLALGCVVPKTTKFDRKNYFYPDLPKAYQISQYDEPITQNGCVKLISEGREIAVGITRAHLEEDAGKLTHKDDASLVDLNRAGTPLLEIVTEPEITSSKDAKNFLIELQKIARYLEISTANMEEGQMRCDANISLKKKGSKTLGAKVEVKNLNSFKMVERAIEYEIKRQEELLEDNKKIDQETRGWNDAKQKTYSQRSKEEAQDYRYFPEPDMPPLDFTRGKSLQASEKSSISVADILKSLPELPAQKRVRFAKEFELGVQEVELLVGDKNLANYFEEVVSEAYAWIKDQEIKLTNEIKKKIIKRIFGLLTTQILGKLNESGQNITDIKITPDNFGELVIMVEKGTINNNVAKDIVNEMYDTGKNPNTILEEKGLHLAGAMDLLEEKIDEVLGQNQKAVADYMAGQEKALQFLLGQVMAKTKGAANPGEVKEQLISKLGK